eukprot:TRINITY_DN3884_c0_g1_i1.p1 TRINITY_DN3884_c0_g1~~TRINITY_DN3884_c0_g1_i1.p1  ORF type:complete len:262 (-),score=61.59 TRINITY_DN3884_c0_g1_i1:132-917(-)
MSQNPFDDGPTEPSNPFDDETVSTTETTSPSGLFTYQNEVPESTQHDLMYKVIILGESGVGKTNLLGRWKEDKYDRTSATLNVELSSKVFKINYEGTSLVVKIQLWDTAGQEQYRSVTSSYYRKCQGAILVYDITKLNTFSSLESWLNELKNAPGNENIHVMLVGNKSDLADERDVAMEDGLEFAKQHHLNFLETSAKTGDNVQKAFQILLGDIHKTQLALNKDKSKHNNFSDSRGAAVDISRASNSDDRNDSSFCGQCKM